MKTNVYFTIPEIIIWVFALSVGCGDPQHEDTPTEPGDKVEETGPIKDAEPSLPVTTRDKTYMGKEVFVDKETNYEYIIVGLDPGDPPLLDIAEMYLGDKDLWPVIVEYNHIPDPRNIPDWTPLKVPIRKAPRNAWLTAIFNRVLAKRTIDPDWADAILNMELTIGDGVRTLRNSKATVSYDRGGDLSLGENSMVFISDLSYPELNKPKKSNLNLEEGTLTITKEKLLGNEEIEIFTTEATVKPKIKPGSELDFRTKKTEMDSTLVMSFRGEIGVTASGKTVDLSSGEGSEVEKGKTPSEPETLLTAPSISDKQIDATYYYGNPTLRWEKVNGADVYLLEIAFDAGFTKIHKVFPALSKPETSTDFKKGLYYWRVCAIDARGFEGYWSRTSRFDILKEGQDENAPVTAFEYVNGKPIEIEGKLYLPPGTGIKFTSKDDLAGVKTVIISIDGGIDEEYGGRVIYPKAGFHRITFFSIDRAGKSEKKRELSFIVDSVRPTVDLEVSP